MDAPRQAPPITSRARVRDATAGDGTFADGAPAGARRWGAVHVAEAITLRAPHDALVALYLDYERWPRLFPATIRGVRLLHVHGDVTTVEVDHRTEGRVINVLRRRSPREIELEESKPRYEATFVNRFEPVAEGTRYTVVADVRLRMPYALLAPVLRPVVRRSLRRYVLEPMRAYAEAAASHGAA